MNLQDYLESKRMQPIEFAVLSGIGNTTIYRILKGDVPSPRIARKIEQVTKKSVTFEALRGKHAKR